MAEKTRTKFTPGPWVVEKDGSHVFVMGPEGWVVTEAFYLGLDVAKANAALIAAAPDLYQACVDAVEVCEERYPTTWNPTTCHPNCHQVQANGIGTTGARMSSTTNSRSRRVQRTESRWMAWRRC